MPGKDIPEKFKRLAGKYSDAIAKDTPINISPIAVAQASNAPATKKGLARTLMSLTHHK